MRWFKNNYARKTEISRHRNAAERLREPSQPPPDPAEELLREWLELSALGVDWVKKWLVLRGWLKLPRLCVGTRGWLMW
jgi:hypothetical protein